jgi:membrane protein YdbS with pleckstrin-like domain
VAAIHVRGAIERTEGMKVLHIVEVLLLLVTMVALTYVYFAFREHFPWLLVGFGIGVVAGATLTILIPRHWRGKKENP